MQEIPNISFLDIADTMLESNKTFYNRENWILRVWKEWRSIEVQPQDTIRLTLNSDYDISETWLHYIQFDKSVSSLNYTTCEAEKSWNVYEVNIKETWYYTIAYWWEIQTNWATNFNISVSRNWILWEIIMSDRYKDTVCPEFISWWKYVPNVLLQKWDTISMSITINSTVKILKTTYLSIQFQQYTLWKSI